MVPSPSRPMSLAPDALLDALDVGVMLLDGDGHFRYANRAAHGIFGFAPGEIATRTGRDPRWDLVDEAGHPLPPEERPSVRALRTGVPVQAVVGVLRGDGATRAWINASAVPHLRADGTVERVLVTFTHLTAQQLGVHETRRALDESIAHAQRVVDAVPGIVYQWLHPPTGPDHVTFLGGRILELLGVDPILARRDPETFFQRVPAEARDALDAAIASAVSRGAVFEHELPYLHRAFGLRWARVRGVPEDTPDGLLYTGIILDVTESHLLAERVRRAQRREAMAQMAGGIAHNFNNMLATILPNLELAREGASEAQRALIADAERAAHNAADLVRRMLALGRSEGRTPATAADLATVVREVLHICRNTLDKGIALDERILVPVAPVPCAEGDLQQIVLNLCLNARDAMARSERKQLTIAVEPEGTGHVRLVVRDSGIGMFEETQRRLGEPFFSTKETGRGTGLGLATTFQTIGEAGGSWHVASALGQGTTFTVTLPLARGSGPAAAPPEPGPAPAGPGVALLVDDEELVRKAMQRMLERSGYAVLAAGGAEDALRHARGPDARRISVVLLDLSMPGTSGQALLPRLRELLPDAPVVVMSGHIADRSELAGAAEVIQKPVGSREVLAAIHRARGQTP